MFKGQLVPNFNLLSMPCKILVFYVNTSAECFFRLLKVTAKFYSAMALGKPELMNSVAIRNYMPFEPSTEFVNLGFLQHHQSQTDAILILVIFI